MTSLIKQLAKFGTRFEQIHNLLNFYNVSKISTHLNEVEREVIEEFLKKSTTQLKPDELTQEEINSGIEHGKIRAMSTLRTRQPGLNISEAKRIVEDYFAKHGLKFGPKVKTVPTPEIPKLHNIYDDDRDSYADKY